jgi:hypothetical protein
MHTASANAKNFFILKIPPNFNKFYKNLPLVWSRGVSAALLRATWLNGLFYFLGGCGSPIFSLDDVAHRG